MDEEALITALNKGAISVLAKPNAKKSEVIGFDKSRQAWRVAIAARAEDNEANIELIRFLSKIAKKRVKIASGLTSKQKIVKYT